jgi:hypothetical protein
MNYQQRGWFLLLLVIVDRWHPTVSLEYDIQPLMKSVNGKTFVDNQLKITCRNGEEGVWQRINIQRTDGLNNGTSVLQVLCERPKTYYTIQQVAQVPKSTQVNTNEACDLPPGSDTPNGTIAPEVRALFESGAIPGGRRLLGAAGGGMSKMAGAAAVGISVAALAVAGAALGVAMDCKNRLDDLNDQFDVLKSKSENRLNAIEDFQKTTEAWQHGVGDTLAGMKAHSDTVDKALEDTAAGLDKINQRAGAQENVLRTIIASTDEQFQKQHEIDKRLASDISALNGNINTLAASTDAQLKAVVKGMNNQTSYVVQQLQDIRRATQSQTTWTMGSMREAERKLNQLRATVYDFYDRKNLRHLLSQMINVAIQAVMYLNWVPFLDMSQAIAPLPDEFDTKVMQLDQFLLVWTTRGSSGSLTQRSATASLRCRAEPLLEFARPWTTSLDIMDMVGAQDCDPSEDPVTGERAPNFSRCVCWWEVSRSYCAGGPALNLNTRPVLSLAGWNGECPTGSQSHGDEFSAQIITNSTQFHDWMNDWVCNAPPVTANANEPPKYGLVSMRLGRTTVTSSYDACHFNMEQINVEAGPIAAGRTSLPGGLTLPFAMYQYIEMSYKVVAPLIQQIELLRYGGEPDNITYDLKPFNRGKGTLSYQCMIATFVSIDPVFEPLYELRLRTTDHSVIVRLDNETEQTISSATVTSAYSFVLPVVQYVAGSIFAEDNKNTTYVYDIPMSEVSMSGDAGARRGKITYIAAPAEWMDTHSTWDIHDWISRNKMQFDHKSAGNSLHRYQQLVNQNGKCKGYSTGATWCAMTNHFTVARVDDGNGFLGDVVLTPESDWEMSFDVRIPAGEVVLVQTSTCPRTQVQLLGDDSLTVIFGNDADATASFRFFINGPCPVTRDIVVGARGSSTQRIPSCPLARNESTTMTVQRVNPADGNWIPCSTFVNVTAEMLSSDGLQTSIVASQFIEETANTRSIVAFVNQQNTAAIVQGVTAAFELLTKQLHDAGVVIPGINQPGSVASALANITDQVQQTGNLITQSVPANLTAATMADMQNSAKLGTEVQNKLIDLAADLKLSKEQSANITMQLEDLKNKSIANDLARAHYIQTEVEFDQAIQGLGTKAATFTDKMKDIGNTLSDVKSTVSGLIPNINMGMGFGIVSTILVIGLVIALAVVGYKIFGMLPKSSVTQVAGGGSTPSNVQMSQMAAAAALYHNAPVAQATAAATAKKTAGAFGMQGSKTKKANDGGARWQSVYNDDGDMA